MSQKSSEAAMLDRANLDARIAFVTASFLLAYGFAALLDRVGAPERFVGAASPWFTIVALATLGFLLHSMRVSVYYAAGRAVPAAYAGFANAAVVIAIVLPFAARLAGHGWWTGVIAGVFLGVGCAALYLGPLLRKTGAFSIAGLLAARFPSPAPRFALIAAIAAASGLLAVAGGQMAVEAFVDLTGASRIVAAFAIGAASLIIAGPGGLAGAIWAAAAAAGVAVFGFGWPLAALGLHGELPVNLLGGGPGWPAAAELLAGWKVMPDPNNIAVEIGAMIAVALGIATLAPVLAPSVTTSDAAAARRSGYAACGWTLALALLVAAATASAAISYSKAVEGQPPERLPPPIYAASARGLVAVCGAQVSNASQAQRACAQQGLAPSAPVGAANVRPVDEAYLLGALPGAADLGASTAGLLASALIALGLVLAAAGLQACGAAVGHDALYRIRGEIDLTSRRLAITRMALVAVSAFGYVASVAGLATPGGLISLALAISAACVAPSMALAFWPRAGDREALAAILGGAAGLAAARVFADADSAVETYALAGLAGAALGLGMGAVSGLASRQDKPEAQAFIARVLYGDAQIVAPDKGA
jgi:cation/acetate symporter